MRLNESSLETKEPYHIPGYALYWGYGIFLLELTLFYIFFSVDFVNTLLFLDLPGEADDSINLI